MWYIEWTVHEYQGDSKGRFAVYFRTRDAALIAAKDWRLDHKVDRCEVKKL